MHDIFSIEKEKTTVKLITLHYANWTYTCRWFISFSSLPWCNRNAIFSPCCKIKERLNVDLLRFLFSIERRLLWCTLLTSKSKTYVIYGFFSRTLPLPRRFPTFVFMSVCWSLFRQLIFISMSPMKYLFILYFQNRYIKINIDSRIKL